VKKRKRESRYVSILVVHAHDVQSLIEVMRYDRCCPATEVESHKINRIASHASEPADHVIRLLRFAAADNPPTIGRWESFGCTVLDERSTEDVQLTGAEQLNLARVAGIRL
jgi:hypothetical protein